MAIITVDDSYLGQVLRLIATRSRTSCFAKRCRVAAPAPVLPLTMVFTVTTFNTPFPVGRTLVDVFLINGGAGGGSGRRGLTSTVRGGGGGGASAGGDSDAAPGSGPRALGLGVPHSDRQWRQRRARVHNGFEQRTGGQFRRSDTVHGGLNGCVSRRQPSGRRRRRRIGGRDCRGGGRRLGTRGAGWYRLGRSRRCGRGKSWLCGRRRRRRRYQRSQTGRAPAAPVVRLVPDFGAVPAAKHALAALATRAAMVSSCLASPATAAAAARATIPAPVGTVLKVACTAAAAAAAGLRWMGSSPAPVATVSRV